MAHQPFLSAVNSSLELSTNPLVARLLLHLHMPNTFSLFHHLIPQKIPICLVLLWAFFIIA